MATTIALYSHDSVGLGHARRNRALAHALADHLPQLVGGPVRGLLVVGSPDVARDSLPDGWDWLVLPGVAPAAAGGHTPRHLGMSMSELAAVRGAVIDAALAALEPDLFVVDRHPFGIAGELRSTIRRLRGRGCRTVLGLREVLDDPEVTTEEWRRLGGPAAVAENYDAVWIYGDPAVYDPRLSGEVPPPLANLAVATGYLANGRPEAASPPDPEAAVASGSEPADRPGAGAAAAPTGTVLTVLGGGSDGAALARVAARASVPTGHRHVIVTGPQMSAADTASVREAAGVGTTVVSRVDNLPGLLERAAAVVCMGGYNTIAEVMATSTPALVVPRVERRSEQRRRATALAAAGAIQTRPLATLDPHDITEFFTGAVGRQVDRSGLDRDGLARIPRLAAHLVSPRVRHRPSTRNTDALVSGGRIHDYAG